MYNVGGTPLLIQNE